MLGKTSQKSVLITRKVNKKSNYKAAVAKRRVRDLNPCTEKFGSLDFESSALPLCQLSVSYILTVFFKKVNKEIDNF